MTDEVVKAAAELKAGSQPAHRQARRRRATSSRKLLIGGAIAVAAAIGIKKVLGRDEDEFDYEP